MKNFELIDSNEDEIVFLKQNPAAMVQNLKSLAYTLKDAFCDIIDNSITANADKIWINYTPNQSTISIIDNGNGMSKEKLIDAMSVFNTDPRIIRSDSDLGRFGMGLKTASLSQCNKFTVASKTSNGETSAYTFDVEFIENISDKYSNLAILNQNPNQVKDYDSIPKNGTLVLWENLDFFSGMQEQDSSQNEYNELLIIARNHIALIFHRFLEGQALINEKKKLQIFWNNELIEPFNPFNPNNPATQKQGPNHYSINNGNDLPTTMTLEGFTLPERSKVNDYDWDYYSGPQHQIDKEAYLDNQGFYVYRLNRLIAYGPKIKNWFGLQAPRPITQLSRVAVNIGNDLDNEWGIELKKADLQPNPLVKSYLSTMINQVTNQSKKIYQGKGTPVDNNKLSVWEIYKEKGQFRIYIDQKKPVIENFIQELEEYNLVDSFEKIISTIETTLPYPSIFSFMADNVVMQTEDEEIIKTAQKYINTVSDLDDDFWKDLHNNLKKITGNEKALKLINLLKEKNDSNILE